MKDQIYLNGYYYTIDEVVEAAEKLGYRLEPVVRWGQEMRYLIREDEAPSNFNTWYDVAYRLFHQVKPPKPPLESFLYKEKLP